MINLKKEACKLANDKINLNSIELVFSEVQRYTKEKGHRPEEIRLTKHELDKINNGIMRNKINSWQHDLKSRLRPDLLPDFISPKEITYNDYIYGVKIVPVD